MKTNLTAAYLLWHTLKYAVCSLASITVLVPYHRASATAFLQNKTPLKIKIRVSNPVSAATTYISVKSAERYVARGRARWQNDSTIYFIEDSYDRRAAERAYYVMSQLAYDRIGQMSVEQVTGLPVIRDPVKLFMLRT
jgi:hypothetical protein